VAVADRPTFFAELKRRNVLRAGVLYAGAAWAFGQGLSQFSPAVGLPDWATRWFLIAAATGFPFWIAFAWFYEFTPQGLKRESEIAPDDSIAHSTGRGLDKWIIAVLVIAVVLLLTNTFVWRKGAGLASEPALASAPAKSIAVLPFENLSEDKGNAYFADGMQDLILTKLADIGQLKVISRTSTMKYASHPDDLKTIAQQLGVATILEGSVQKAGNQVLINVQLIDARTDAHLWAQSYTRSLDNVFGVEGEVAGQIASALKAKLSPAETKSLATSLSTDPAANDLFLRGEYFFNKGDINFDVASIKQAVALYRQAIARVPDFALARAKLSRAESDLVFLSGGGEDIQQLNTNARAEAERALALAPDLVEAHLAIGYCELYGRSDYPAALAAFDTALKLHPNDVDALASKGNVLVFQGHFAEALTAYQQALASDPRNSGLAMGVGQLYMDVGRYAEAQAAYQHALALDPDNMEAKVEYTLSLLFANGDVAAAWAAAQGDGAQLRGWRISLLMYQRKYQAALALLASIPDTPDNFPNSTKALRQAQLYWLSGDVARARPLFEQALPLLRARLKSVAGSDTTQGAVWGAIASAELGLGHTTTALTAIAQSQALMARSPNIAYRLSAMVSYARLYAQASRPDLAVPPLEKALATPGTGFFYAPVMLWIDPVWDPIRHDPRFAALQKKYASAKPAAASSGATP
jgi:TolB-like protein/lipoprotein NlpI